MKTLEEIKYYYADATKDEVILDNYLDMVEYLKLRKTSDKLKKYLKEENDKLYNFYALDEANYALREEYKVIAQILNEGGDE